MSEGQLQRVQQQLGDFDREAELQHLRDAGHSLSEVDLLRPATAQERLALRGRTLALWLALLRRLDDYAAALSGTALDDARAQAQRNRLAWQADALDQTATQQVQLFVQQYYTPAPVDHAELTAALEAAGLAASRRRQLLP